MSCLCDRMDGDAVAEDIVPVGGITGTQALEWHGGGDGLVAYQIGLAITGGIGVGGGDEQRSRHGCAISDQLIEAPKRGRSHAAGGGRVKRVVARSLECREAHRVDRRLGDDEPR